MTANAIKAMTKVMSPKKLLKDIKGGFDTWGISLRSIKVDKPKEPEETKGPKKTKIGIDVGLKIKSYFRSTRMYSWMSY